MSEHLLKLLEKQGLGLHLIAGGGIHSAFQSREN